MTTVDELMALARDSQGFGWSVTKEQLRTAIEQALAEAREEGASAALRNPPRHKYWGAGEADCPKDLKATNGELHTLRCKVCGVTSPRNEICNPVSKKQAQPEEPLILAVYNGKDGRRQWASTGTWLYPGEALAQIKWAQKEPT